MAAKRQWIHDAGRIDDHSVTLNIEELLDRAIASRDPAGKAIAGAEPERTVGSDRDVLRGFRAEGLDDAVWRDAAHDRAARW